MQAERPDVRNRVAVAAAVVAAAVVLTARLFVPPIVGLADNGDGSRLLSPSGLAFATDRPEERYFGWMQPRFAYAERKPDASAYRSSEQPLLEAAVRAARAVSKSPAFDIRFLAAVHALLLIAAIGALVAAARDLALPAQAAAAALLVFFFTDPGYVAPFNSLYSQSASFTFLLLTAAAAALAVRRGFLSGQILAAYFLAAALFVCSKPQEVVQAPLLGLLGARMAWPGATRRGRALALALAVLLVGLAVRYYWSAERSLGWVTRYNVVFLVILPSSPDPAADLVELGLDPSLRRYAKVSAWVPESPAADPRFRDLLQRISPRAFLLRHPRRLAALVRAGLEAAPVLRPSELGNYAKESGLPAGAQANAPWSETRAVLGGVPWLFVLFGGTLAAAGWTYRRAPPRGRLFREALSATVMMAVASFAAAVAGDTHVELVRHLYTFDALCDLILAADVVWILQALSASGWTNRRVAGAAAVLAAVLLASQLSLDPSWAWRTTATGRVGPSTRGASRGAHAPSPLRKFLQGGGPSAARGIVPPRGLERPASLPSESAAPLTRGHPRRDDRGLLAGWRRSTGRARLARGGLGALCIVAVMEFLVCAFADAHIELNRHLYVYFAALDLVLVGPRYGSGPGSRLKRRGVCRSPPAVLSCAPSSAWGCSSVWESA